MGLKKLIPPALLPRAYAARNQLKTTLRKLKGHEMSPKQFRSLLDELGFRPGATVMVHSSMGEIAAAVPGMEATEVIALLQELLTEEGTLLMPTFTFGGLQWDYVQETRVFKPHRTPSKMGLLTEIFRRTSGVTRSLHPTHPVAAWGKHAESMLAEHHQGTAFGKNSPLYKLTEHDGKVIALGASPESFTLFHVAEELHPQTFAYNYGEAEFDMEIVTREETLPYRIRPLRGDRKRDFERSIGLLVERGLMRHERKRGLEIAVSNAAAFLEGCEAIINEGRFQDMES